MYRADYCLKHFKLVKLTVHIIEFITISQNFVRILTPENCDVLH